MESLEFVGMILNTGGRRRGKGQGSHTWDVVGEKFIWISQVSKRLPGQDGMILIAIPDGAVVVTDV